MSDIPTRTSGPFWTEGIITRAMVERTRKDNSTHATVLRAYDSMRNGSEIDIDQDQYAERGHNRKGFITRSDRKNHYISYHDSGNPSVDWHIFIPKSLKR